MSTFIGRRCMDYLYNRAKLFERKGNKQLKLFNTSYQYYRLNVNISKLRIQHGRCSILSIRHPFSSSVAKHPPVVMLLCVTNKSLVYHRIPAICETFVTSARFNDYVFYVNGCKQGILTVANIKENIKIISIKTWKLYKL